MQQGQEQQLQHQQQQQLHSHICALHTAAAAAAAAGPLRSHDAAKLQAILPRFSSCLLLLSLLLCLQGSLPQAAEARYQLPHQAAGVWHTWQLPLHAGGAEAPHSI
jgi:hypothetical protein